MEKSLKPALIKFIRPLFDNTEYVVSRGLAKGLKRRGGLGFIPSLRLNEEEQFLLSLDLKDKVIFDIGGWEGVFTMFFARVAGVRGRVVTFEPNPVNVKKIAHNLQINGLSDRVNLLPMAVGNAPGEASLFVQQSISGVGTMTQSSKKDDPEKLTVPVNSLDNLAQEQHLPIPDFVKIDVEGYEFYVLEGMEKVIASHRPDLFIELHEYEVGNSVRVIQHLLAVGYNLVHVETGQKIAVEDASLTHWQHLYCTSRQ